MRDDIRTWNTNIVDEEFSTYHTDNTDNTLNDSSFTVEDEGIEEE